MNEVMFVTGGELLQFLPISSKKRWYDGANKITFGIE